MDASGSILIVDDNEMNRDMLSRRLGREGLGVVVAKDGARALELIEAGGFDLILLDVMMPGLSGMEVLRAIREVHPATDLPVIMATAREESADVIEAFGLGANDYVTKPLDFPVVLARVRTQLALKHAIDQIRHLERGLEERNRALEVANARMRRDLKAAAKIQEALLPRSMPDLPGMEFAWTFRPCDELAGDSLGVVQLDANRVGLYVLDVSGHGVASALLAVSVTRVLTPAEDPASILFDIDEGGGRPRAVPPALVADRLNRLFPSDPTTEQYFTVIYGILDVASGEFRFVSAGHPGPILVTESGAPLLIRASGLPIGLGDLEYEEHRVLIGDGDRLYLYSDGVPEAMGVDSELFGGDRLLAAIDRVRAGPLAGVVIELRAEVERWGCESGLLDDLSILAIGRDRASDLDGAPR